MVAVASFNIFLVAQFNLLFSLLFQEDPDITEQLREKRMRAKWAEAARAR